MALAFPTDLPIDLRPYHLQQFAEAILMLGTDLSFVTVRADVLADMEALKAAIQDSANWTDPAETLQYQCPRCSGQGTYEESKDTGNPADTDQIHDVTCDGWGFTKTAVTPERIVWPESAI
jgi:hypothetical protein